MATFSLQSLKNEITNDPTSLGYATDVASGSHQLIANKINNKSDSRSCRRSVVQFYKVSVWSASNDRLKKLRAASATDSPIQNAALVAVQLFSMFKGNDTFDVDDPYITPVMTALVESGVLSLQDALDFSNLAVVTPASRCQELWTDKESVDHNEVAQALRQQ